MINKLLKNLDFIITTLLVLDIFRYTTNWIHKKNSKKYDFFLPIDLDFFRLLKIRNLDEIENKDLISEKFRINKILLLIILLSKNNLLKNLFILKMFTINIYLVFYVIISIISKVKNKDILPHENIYYYPSILYFINQIFYIIYLKKSKLKISDYKYFVVFMVFTLIIREISYKFKKKKFTNLIGIFISESENYFDIRNENKIPIIGFDIFNIFSPLISLILIKKLK
tara:strand:- start:2723 stop:3403 length:681 start_codon:yes stop_codon:yes gene_type:complete